MRRQEEFQRYLLESFPDLILVIDLDGRYSFVSSRIRDLRGFKPEDLLGKKVEEEQDYSPELLALYRDLTAGRENSVLRLQGAASRWKLANHASLCQPAVRCGK